MVPGRGPSQGPGGLESSELLEGGKAGVLSCLSLFLEKCWGGGAEETFCSSWASSPPWQTSCLSRSLSPPSQSMKPEVLKCLAQELTWQRECGERPQGLKTLGFGGCLFAPNIACSQFLSSSFLSFFGSDFETWALYSLTTSRSYLWLQGSKPWSYLPWLVSLLNPHRPPNVYRLFLSCFLLKKKKQTFYFVLE